MNYVRYIKERFPIVPLFLYTTATQIGINTLISSYSPIKIVYASFIYLLFLLHLRILDEFKDYTYDSEKYPNRPVQKGVISLNELKLFGIVNIILIFFLALIVESVSYSLGLIVSMLYTGLMYKEFFIKNILKKNITLYLLSHEIVFIPLFIYFYSIFFGSFWVPATLEEVFIVFYFILPIVLIEIGRKIKHRFDSKGEKTDDTYSYHWGEMQTIQVFGLLVLLEGFLGLFISNYSNTIAMLVAVSGFIIIVGSRFFRKFIVANSMLITTVYGLLLPLLPIL